ncbi:MAG: thioredoxin family protein [Magnetococcus sp. DMHC-1]|nr:thioredoxin family protein [Magnetococcales bacterium]
MALKSTPSESLRRVLHETPHHKLLFVIFSGKQCFVCEKLRQHLPWFANSHREKIHVMVVDVQRYPELTTEYGITGIPTIMVFAKGNRIHTAIGVSSKSELKKILKETSKAI